MERLKSAEKKKRVKSVKRSVREYNVTTDLSFKKMQGVTWNVESITGSHWENLVS